MSDNTLTYDKFMGLAPLATRGVEIHEVPLYGVQIQAKRHKRKSSRRWQKKWLKRFGTVTEYRRIFDKGTVLADTKHGVVYAHPEEVRAIRAASTESSQSSTYIH